MDCSVILPEQGEQGTHSLVMAFSLRWPLLCVWLHTHACSCNGQVDVGSFRGHMGGTGFASLVAFGRKGEVNMLFEKRARPRGTRVHAFEEESKMLEQDLSSMVDLVEEGELPAASKDSEDTTVEKTDDRVSQLQAFLFHSTCKEGSVSVELLKPQNVKCTLELLTDSFSELLLGPLTYRPLLSLIVRENLIESQRLFPNNVVLVAMYEQNEGIEPAIGKVVAGTVEIYFAFPNQSNNITNPCPPSGAPYLCNMAVKKQCRRRGIGWQLLQAAEELAISMGFTEMYLHCRLIDTVPLDMYQRAGYRVVDTSSIFSFLVFQRRKHLMRKLLVPQKLE